VRRRTQKVLRLAATITVGLSLAGCGGEESSSGTSSEVPKRADHDHGLADNYLG
jgi:hypothetical protein